MSKEDTKGCGKQRKNFSENLEKLSLLYEHLVLGRAAEGIKKIPTQKCSVLIRKRQCSLFMLLNSCFLEDQPAIRMWNTKAKKLLHDCHDDFNYLGITLSLHFFSQHLIHRICNLLHLRNTLSLNFSLTPRLSEHRIKEISLSAK